MVECGRKQERKHMNGKDGEEKKKQSRERRSEAGKERWDLSFKKTKKQ